MSAMAIATYVLVSVFVIAYMLFFVVITIGGFFDLKQLIKGIKEKKDTPQDDGCHPTHPE
jgi:hypothetical protein